MSKPLAAVRLEGTITTGGDPDLLNPGTVIPGVVEKLEKLYETHDVLILSPAVKYPRGAKMLYDFLIGNLIAFTDVWCGDGLPSADLWIDNNAVKL